MTREEDAQEWQYRQLLRQEMQARPVDFHARVRVGISTFGGMMSPNGQYYLTVRGDAFEVSSRLHLVPRYFCYRADDTTIAIVMGLLHNWVEISGRPGRPVPRIRVGGWNLIPQVWQALVRAGAHPVGPPN